MVRFKPAIHPQKTELTEREKAVLEQIAANSTTTIPEIASNLDLTERQVRYVIDCLRKNGVINRDGPNKTGGWKILQ